MFTKTQFKIVIGYALFVILFAHFKKHGLESGQMTPLSAILYAPIPLAFSVFGIQNGWVIGKFCVIDRDESPISFWVLVAIGLVAGLGLFLWGLRGLFQ